MRRLRILAIESPSTDPRQNMADLAARFPGALREIDELPLEAIDRKLKDLAQAIDDGTPIALWMEATARFHELTRGVLGVKRWLAGKKQIDDAVRAELEKIAPDLPYAVDVTAWIGELEAIANPPRGRVTDLVFARIATELSIDESAARRLVFK